MPSTKCSCDIGSNVELSSVFSCIDGSLDFRFLVFRSSLVILTMRVLVVDAPFELRPITVHPVRDSFDSLKRSDVINCVVLVVFDGFSRMNFLLACC